MKCECIVADPEGEPCWGVQNNLPCGTAPHCTTPKRCKGRPANRPGIHETGCALRTAYDARWSAEEQDALNDDSCPYCGEGDGDHRRCHLIPVLEDRRDYG